MQRAAWAGAGQAPARPPQARAGWLACARGNNGGDGLEAALHLQRPGVRVVVHPECPSAVVRAADSAGSTSHIIKYCADAKPGAKIAVGTEENLVLRLAERHKAEGKLIMPLKPNTRCSNMAKTTEERLADLLDTLDTALPLTLPADVAEHAQVALTRMLDICS